VDVEADGLELWEGMVDERAHRMLAALVEARDELVRWPIAEEWERSGRKPSRRSFVRYFGSWEGACRAAGTSCRSQQEEVIATDEAAP
jgi:Homing endonuclease associated repeat